MDLPPCKNPKTKQSDRAAYPVRALWELLTGERAKLVDAIEARTPGAASAAARAYHERALAVIGSLPRSSSVRIDDPMIARLFQTAYESPRSDRH